MYEFLLSGYSRRHHCRLQAAVASAAGQPFISARASDPVDKPVPTILLVFYWSVTSLVPLAWRAKMPWLTIHIALPLILGTAWAVGWWSRRSLRQVGKMSGNTI